MEILSQSRLSLQSCLQRLFRVLTTLKGKDKSLNEDEKTVHPRDNSVEIGFFRPQGVETPM